MSFPKHVKVLPVSIFKVWKYPGLLVLAVLFYLIIFFIFPFDESQWLVTHSTRNLTDSPGSPFGCGGGDAGKRKKQQKHWYTWPKMHTNSEEPLSLVICFILIGISLNVLKYSCFYVLFLHIYFFFIWGEVSGEWYLGRGIWICLSILYLFGSHLSDFV